MDIANLPILSIHILLPLLGAALLLALQSIYRLHESCIVKYAALGVALGNFFLSCFIAHLFDYQADSLQFVEKKIWIADYGIGYALGIDGMSLSLIMLTTFLTIPCILASWRSIKSRVAEFMSMLIMLQGLVIGVFAAADLVLFYLFFEAVLVPMFLMIGIWGGDKRVYAAFKFFLYTLAGSVLFLLAILYITLYSGTADLMVLNELVPQYGLDTQKVLWLAFFIAFAVKIPMLPFHTWLPDAHVQAPTAGSVMLAGVLLKIGTYGFLRFAIPLLPQASAYFADAVIILSIIAVLYTSLVALAQHDVKKLIAYSSIAHMGYVTAGIFAFSKQGIEGAMFTMISHGLTSGALFLCFGLIYERVHAKEISAYGGLTSIMPVFSFLFMIFTLSAVALPTTSGFIGEFFILFAAFKNNNVYGMLLAFGMVLGAAYMLWLYARLMFGQTASNLKEILDLSIREKIYLIPIAFLIVTLGVMPNVLLKFFAAPTQILLDQITSTPSAARFDSLKLYDENEENYVSTE